MTSGKASQRGQRYPSVQVSEQSAIPRQRTCVLRVSAVKCSGAWSPPNTSAAVKLALMGPFDYIKRCESSLTLCLKRLELTCVLRVSAVKCLGAWPPPNTSARLYSSPWSGLLMHSNLYTLNPEFPVSSQYFTCILVVYIRGNVRSESSC